MLLLCSVSDFVSLLAKETDPPVADFAFEVMKSTLLFLSVISASNETRDSEVSREGMFDGPAIGFAGDRDDEEGEAIGWDIEHCGSGSCWEGRSGDDGRDGSEGDCGDMVLQTTCSFYIAITRENGWGEWGCEAQAVLQDGKV
jgi:hypothetical protein